MGCTACGQRLRAEGDKLACACFGHFMDDWLYVDEEHEGHAADNPPPRTWRCLGHDWLDWSAEVEGMVLDQWHDPIDVALAAHDEARPTWLRRRPGVWYARLWDATAPGRHRDSFREAIMSAVGGEEMERLYLALVALALVPTPDAMDALVRVPERVGPKNADFTLRPRGSGPMAYSWVAALSRTLRAGADLDSAARRRLEGLPAEWNPSNRLSAVLSSPADR